MTSKQKQEIFISIDILQKAHEELEHELKRKNIKSAQEIFISCQEVAIALGEYIEEFEGENHITVSYLEEYCEILFQMHESTLSNLENKNNLRKMLKKQLFKIKNSVQKEINAKKEIVFFPYKASMWDSLESVYLAAKADSNCDVYCVPIPYYDRDETCGLKQMHYEISAYPQYVNVIDWRNYDFEVRKPDIAYIHNPYDDQNLVTSVHPRYYSANLKKYVRTLIYIPYNVSGGILGEIHKLLPAYLNVDHIMVQHKRQIPYFPIEISKKVHAFGSPKFDKIINQTITPEMIPDEWKSKLKDVILFLNTGINGILVNNEKSLLKLQYILKIAKEENVTILWRPHPLLEATIRSMRPELLKLYQETLWEFKNSENGILDQTENAELSIGLCDAYVGEASSSISHMFGVTGKPLFFIRQGILAEQKDIENLKFSCCVLDTANPNSLWVIAASRNGLLKISKEGIIEKFYIIPNEKERSNLYSDILVNGKKLYLIPRNAKEIAIFDVESEKFTKVAISNASQDEKFNKGYLYKNKIYMIPRLYKKMLILDCINNTLGYNTDIVNKLKKITGIPDIFVSANGSRLIGDSIYLAAPNKPYLLEYNLKSLKTKTHKISGTESGFCCLEKISDKIVLGTMSGCELIVWDTISATCQIIKNFPKGWDTAEDICFWDIVEIDGEAYIFPRKNSMILRLSIENLSLSRLEKEFPFSTSERKSGFFNHPTHFMLVKKLENGVVVVQDANRHGLARFCTDGTFKWKQIILTEQEELKAFKESFSKQGANLPWGICETKYHSLRRLISYVRFGLHDREEQKEAYRDAALNLDGTAGQKIHEFIMEKTEEKLMLNKEWGNEITSI